MLVTQVNSHFCQSDIFNSTQFLGIRQFLGIGHLLDTIVFFLDLISFCGTESRLDVKTSKVKLSLLILDDRGSNIYIGDFNS